MNHAIVETLSTINCVTFVQYDTIQFRKTMHFADRKSVLILCDSYIYVFFEFKQIWKILFTDNDFISSLKIVEIGRCKKASLLRTFLWGNPLYLSHVHKTLKSVVNNFHNSRDCEQFSNFNSEPNQTSSKQFHFVIK